MVHSAAELNANKRTKKKQLLTATTSAPASKRSHPGVSLSLVLVHLQEFPCQLPAEIASAFPIELVDVHDRDHPSQAFHSILDVAHPLRSTSDWILALIWRCILILLIGLRNRLLTVFFDERRYHWTAFGSSALATCALASAVSAK